MAQKCGMGFFDFHQFIIGCRKSLTLSSFCYKFNVFTLCSFFSVRKFFNFYLRKSTVDGSFTVQVSAVHITLTWFMPKVQLLKLKNCLQYHYFIIIYKPCVSVLLLKQVQERVSVTWFNTFSEKIISYRESESRRLINEKCK